MNKKNLLITSAIISLSLLNVSDVQAENADVKTQDDQIEEVNHHSNEQSSSSNSREKFNRIFKELHTILNDEQKEIIEGIDASENEASLLFKEAVVAHEASEFDQAIEQYDELLAVISETTSEEKAQEVMELIGLFEELAEEEVILQDYDFSNKKSDELDEPEKSESTNESNETGPETSGGKNEVTNEGEKAEPEEPTGSTDESNEGNLKTDEKPAEGKEINEIDESAEGNKQSDSELDEPTKEENINGNNSDNKVAKEYNTPEAKKGDSTKEIATGQPEKQVASTMHASVAEPITSEREVLYDAVLTRPTDGINTRPYGTEGYELVRLVDNLVDHQVHVTREAETPRATWAYIEVTGTDISGWIDKAGIDQVETVLSEKAINYEAKLVRPTDGINTKPFGVSGSQLIRLVDDWEGRRVRATREAVTPRSTWAYVNVVGTDVSGWIDKVGLDIESVTEEREVLYDAVLTRPTDGINTKPYGTEGYELVRLVDDLVGHQVRVTREAETSRSIWAYIEVTGTNISGWIDKAGIDPVETVLSEKAINYEAKLARPTDGINTKPFGVAGSELIRLVDDWEGRRVRTTREAVTPRSTWSYVNVVGTDVSGWIDKAGLDIETVSAERAVDYTAYLTRPTDGINTRPYGTEGYELIQTVGGLVGCEVRVTKEAITPRSTWAYVNIVGTNISGWIDKAGISLGSVAIQQTYYDEDFEEVLNMQMNYGSPQTDLYGEGWKNANKKDVAYYLNPENFANVKNGSMPQYIDSLQIATAGLNVRVTPINGESIGIATQNEIYDVLDETNGWYKIDFNGQKGWVSGSYVLLIGRTQYQNEIENAEMLQFLSLSNPSGISVEDLNRELEGKGILEDKGQAFIDASQRYNINEIYLVSHAMLETGNGTSKLATGVEVNGTTVYNMFGVGAYDGMAVEAGSQRAYEEGWDTPEKAIMGGAKFIANSYINSPTHKQDTLYKMRWNPANPTVHQYATDIGWAVKQTRSLDKIIELSDKYNLTLNFNIPVYK